MPKENENLIPVESFEGEAKIRHELKKNFLYFAENVLKIVPKQGGVEPFILNRAQQHIHQKIESQLYHTGKVRALILKARQQGCSTYVAGRYYWRVIHRKGVNAFILSHAIDTTKKLFAMTRRYYEHCDPLIKPSTSAASATEFNFNKMDSSYYVGTAGSKETGRGGTIHFMHGCLGQDTLVIDGDTGGLVPLRDVSNGFTVLTHTGKKAKVSFVSSQEKECLEVVFDTLPSFPLTVTDEHKVFTRDGWVEMGDMDNGDTIGYPVKAITNFVKSLKYRAKTEERPQGGGSQAKGPYRIRPSYNVGRIIGLYLAEGSIIRQTSGSISGVVFTVHRKEVDRTVEWLKRFGKAKVYDSKDSLTSHVEINCKSFGTFIENLCGSVESKRVPCQWFQYGEKFAKGMVHGYLSGDGSSDTSSRRISATSIRSAITIGIRDALASLGYGWAGVKFKPAGIRNDRNEKDAYILRLCGYGVDTLCDELGWKTLPRRRIGVSPKVNISNGYAWIPIKKYESIGIKPVMDLEIDHEDHSYCTIHGATHNSEVGFWANADMHFAGVMQSIPTGDYAKGTEIILESTANGPSGKFHDLWQESVKGNSEYITIFTPWYWQTEYRTTPPMGWDINAPEYEEYREIQRQYSLDEAQVYWMHTKRIELGSDWLFKQEYPASAEEAFQTSGDESLIKPEWVLKARECADMIGVGPRVGACDPARFGDDKTSLGHRVGRVFENIEYYEKLDTMEVAAKCKNYIDTHKLDALFIDTNGLGAGVYDKLRLDGYGQWIRPVNFGESAIDKDHYSNKRAECWGLMQTWFKDFPCKIPNLSELHGDLVGPQYGYDARTRLKLESKDDMRKRGVKSPNGGDVLAMTFAEKINPRLHYQRKRDTITVAESNILDYDVDYTIMD